MAATSKVVSYIVGATDVALVGNDHTFEMRAALKASNAKWTTSAQPARWVVSQEAWAERRAEWEATFGVSFVERVS
jgi:ABC-type sugar transport system substrate-binding protein